MNQEINSKREFLKMLIEDHGSSWIHSEALTCITAIEDLQKIETRFSKPHIPKL